MIIIYAENEAVRAVDGWDFPIEELPYLLEEHSGETFVLINNRLYEVESSIYDDWLERSVYDD